MYAVVELSGKQHKVEVDQTLDIDLQKAEKGSKITFDNVLLLADGDPQPWRGWSTPWRRIAACPPHTHPLKAGGYSFLRCK